jgi:PAS domain S-box-containing protein
LSFDTLKDARKAITLVAEHNQGDITLVGEAPKQHGLDLGGVKPENDRKRRPAKTNSPKTFRGGEPGDRINEEASEQFRLLDSITDGFVVLDREWRFSYVNAESERLTGMKREEMLGKSHWDLFPATVGTDLERELRTVIQTGVPAEFENYYAPWDRWFHLKAQPAGNGGISVFYRDITERMRQTRESLLLASIVDSSDDAIISKDLDGVITSWNKSAERLFGYSAEEAIGQTVAALLIPEDRQEEEPDILARLRKGERVDHFQTVRRRKDGSPIDISLTISPIKDQHGRITGASKVARDITEYKRYEQRLAEQAHLLDLTGDAILVRDRQDRIRYWNRAAEEMYGITRDEALGKVSHELLSTVFPEPLPKIMEALLRDGRWSGELSHANRAGSRLVTLSRWVAERDEKGGLIRILESNNDITQRVRVQKELRRANRDLEQFAYSASHDLQEPLRSVKIFSELLSSRYHNKLDGEALEFLGNVRDNANRMEMLVRDLLTYARASTTEKATELADANEALQTALANLAGSIAETSASIEHGSLPQVRVHPVQLAQVFQNLISNAIKYHRPGVAPIISASARLENGNWVFSITDNGIGIEPEYKENIFGLFKRLHTAGEYSGTGIGLALCQRIVERHQGQIWVESEPGKGSTFRFTVPQ